jgi:hypothetical protein
MKLFTAITTTHGVVQVQTLMGMLDFFRDRTIDKVVHLYMDPYIVLARNTAAADFLKHDATHLMFVDADIVFLWKHIERLLSHDVDLVGGLYAKKQEGKLTWVCNALPERPPEQENGLLPLKHIGTGFMLIKRCVFEEMVEMFGDKIGYLEDETDRPMWDFFDMPRLGGRKMSEDWHFCNKARELGFTVYGDTKCLVRHVGTAVYPLKTQVAQSNLEMQKVSLNVPDAAVV